MWADENREKLINAVVYFAINTRHLGITKLCKLLYFLDFEHYGQTGRSVTGSEYIAWPMGPVPVKFWQECKNGPQQDLAARVAIGEMSLAGGKTWTPFKAKSEFDPSEFSKRELALLQDLSERYRNLKADEMVDESHLERLPWYQVYKVEGRSGDVIPYDLAAKKEERELVDELARLHFEIGTNFGL